MKTFFSFLIAILVGLPSAKTQVRGTCIPYDAKRTMPQFRVAVLTSTDPFVQKELWPKYCEILNAAFKCSKHEIVRTKVLHPTKTDMTWILDHSSSFHYSYFKPADFQNHGNHNNKVVTVKTAGIESDWVAVVWEDIEEPYAYIVCGNPQDRLVRILYKEPEPVKKPADTVWLEREKEEVEEKEEVVNQPTRSKLKVNVYVRVQGRIVRKQPIYRPMRPQPICYRPKPRPCRRHRCIDNCPTNPGGPGGAPTHDPGGPGGAPTHDDPGGPGGSPTHGPGGAPTHGRAVALQQRNPALNGARQRQIIQQRPQRGGSPQMVRRGSLRQG